MAGLWPRGDYAPLMEPHRAAPLGADGKPRAWLVFVNSGALPAWLQVTKPPPHTHTVFRQVISQCVGLAS